MKTPVWRPYEVIIWGERKDLLPYRIMVQAFSEDDAKDEAVRHYSRGFSVLPHISRIEVLSDVHLNMARKQQTLFEDVADVCIGHSMDDVQGAAVNLMLTAVQRRARNLADAEARWDELAGRGKQALQRRYGRAMDARDAAAETEIARRLGA